MSDQHHFGLYQPVLNCFLLCLTNQDEANAIKLLASARYSLYLIDLVSAENYSPTLIDNDVCENWSISNRIDIDINRPQVINNIVKAARLVNTDIVDPDTAKEKEYLQTVQQHVKFCYDIERRFDRPIHNFVDNVLDISLSDPDQTEIKNLVKQIKKTLYLGNDVTDIKKEIQDKLKDWRIRGYFY